ncbi:MAG: cyanophycin synthetase, partial [Chitinophagia bacterium]|nr:cyanophycin synthetase [Chitinophagia bacterium]
IEKLAKVKSVVPNTVMRRGYAILNADDKLVYQMHKELDCRVAFFSLQEDNAHIKRHCAKGGLAAVYEHGYVSILKGNWKIRVEKVTNIPLTFSGLAEFNIANVLAATLAAYVQDFKIEDIRQALQTFAPSPALTPGRMNIFYFRNYSVMLDYAHNTHGFKAIGKFLANVKATRKIGVIAGVGDRRDEDIQSLGAAAADMFDEIIIRHDKHLRGRSSEDILSLIKQGIYERDADKPVTVIEKQDEAIAFAFERAIKDCFIVITCDVVPDALEQVKNYKAQEDGAVVV